MSHTSDWQLPVSEAALTAMTREFDDAHRTAYPTMQARAADLVEELHDNGAIAAADSRVGRRGFLLGLGGTGVALALAACSSNSSNSSNASGSGTQNPNTRAASSGSAMNSPYTSDLKVVALENQAVGAYKAALTAAQAGKLGTVPPAVATFVQTAMSQHQDHAKAWNAVLTGAGVPAITNVPLTNQPATIRALGAATSVGAVAKLALELENQAAETYLFATAHVSSAAGIATAASIAPVEAMHAAVLNFVLGNYPVPDAFLGTSMAASPALLTV
ncbi:ferritin-like domain-containing protein [Actinospica robiniae]|uniref:ferritin-like domain-containing protein n=1 Tax=Actinospica robiniae TaxID=304901 RepID=UPI00040A3ABD|nr:ferritin-like domain-containing protein [Actinospica robiniae]